VVSSPRQLDDFSAGARMAQNGVNEANGAPSLPMACLLAHSEKGVTLAPNTQSQAAALCD
jgi:hypothetical protein